MLLASSSLMAQIQMESGNLKAAIAKAKVEKKMVIIMASATWWNPCKIIERKVFPTKEAGEFINPKFVFKKYNLDKDDSDKIVETYKIKGYPTFIILDGNGKEITRMVGAPAETKKFIDSIKNALAKAKPVVEEEEEEASWGPVGWE